MSSTRSKGEASLAKFTDNPERIGKDKPKRKNKNMADAGTPETAQQLDTGDKNHTPNLEDNEDETQNTDPIHEMYLPDLNNTPLSQALKTGLDCGMEDKVMVVSKAEAILQSGHFPCTENIWTDPHIHP